MIKPTAQPSPEATTAADAPASAPSLSAEEIAALIADREALTGLRAKLDADEKARKDAAKAAQVEAEKAGETVKALEAAKARLAELEVDAPLAARWRAHEAAETKRLEERAKDLPEAFARLYKSAGDLEAKRAVLEAFDFAQPKNAPVKNAANPPALGAPASSTVAVDFGAVLNDPAKLAEAKARDPQGFSAWLKAKMSGPSKGPSLGIARFGAPSSQPKSA